MVAGSCVVKLAASVEVVVGLAGVMLTPVTAGGVRVMLGVTVAIFAGLLVKTVPVCVPWTGVTLTVRESFRARPVTVARFRELEVAPAMSVAFRCHWNVKVAVGSALVAVAVKVVTFV